MDIQSHMASQDLQREALPGQLNNFSPIPPFQGTHVLRRAPALAVSNSVTQVSQNLNSKPDLLGLATTREAKGHTKPKGNVNYRLHQDATTKGGSPGKLPTDKSAAHNSPNANDRSTEIESATKKAGRFWPIQRVWQITPQLTETIRLESVSPMARWELESIKEESWNCIGEVFIDHPVDWTQEPEYYEDDDADDENLVGLGA